MAIAPEMEQYLEAFFLEADEELAQMQVCLDRLNQEGAQLSVVEEAGRAMANLKSAAATMGFRSIRDLAHATWDMLDAWRRGGVKDPAVSLELLTGAHRQLREFIEMLRDGLGLEPSVADLTIQLRALVTKEAENPWPEAEPIVIKDLTEQRFIVRFVLDKPCPHPVGRFLVCQGYLAELGNVIASDPPPSTGEAQDELVLRFLFATTQNAVDVRHTIESISHVRMVEVVPAAPGQDSLPPVVKKYDKSLYQGYLTLHVEGRYLDNLSEIAVELAQIRSAYRTLEHEIQPVNPSFAFRLARLGERFEYPLRQLSELLVQMRQIPVEHLTDRLVKTALKHAKELGKEIDVELAGGDIILGLDQAETLLTPLRHLLNMLVEKSAQIPEERLAAGKPKTNHLKFKAQEGESKIILSLSDDGRGMDLEKGFQPGGCLAEVQREIESRGGTLEGQSWPGQGTLLTVEVSPPGDHLEVLGLELGNDLYALPLSAVVEARQATDEAVVRVDGRTYFTQNREMLPLHDLGRLLGRPSEAKGGFWLFVRTQEGCYVLRVPVILGPRQATARPGTASLQILGLAGTCTDSGGQIYFLLSPDELVKLAGTDRFIEKADRRSKA